MLILLEIRLFTKVIKLKWSNWCPYTKGKFRYRYAEREAGHQQAEERGLGQILPSRRSEWFFISKMDSPELGGIDYLLCKWPIDSSLLQGSWQTDLLPDNSCLSPLLSFTQRSFPYRLALCQALFHPWRWYPAELGNSLGSLQWPWASWGQRPSLCSFKNFHRPLPSAGQNTNKATLI